MEHRIISELTGRVITSVHDLKVGSDLVVIETDKGMFSMEHIQNCCELVEVEDVVGDPADLIGARILELRESVNEEDDGHESCTWTFYHIITDKVDIAIRWKGNSNGYYSETVDLRWEGKLL